MPSHYGQHGRGAMAPLLLGAGLGMLSANQRRPYAWGPPSVGQGLGSGLQMGLMLHSALNQQAPERKTLKDAAGFQRFLDTGERVFPEVEAPATKRNRQTQLIYDAKGRSQIAYITPEGAVDREGNLIDWTQWSASAPPQRKGWSQASVILQGETLPRQAIFDPSPNPKEGGYWYWDDNGNFVKAPPSARTVKVGAELTGPQLAKATADPSKRTTGNLEEAMITSATTLGELNAVASTYQRGFLTYFGQAKGLLAKVKDKLSSASDQERAYLFDRTQFTNAVDQLFNAYRAEITGAAASVQELDRLKKTMLNTDQAPTEFEASYWNFRRKVETGLEVKRQMLAEGVPLTADEFDRRVAAAEAAASLNLQNAPSLGNPTAITPGQPTATPGGGTATYRP